jgi:hypothetical protein
MRAVDHVSASGRWLGSVAVTVHRGWITRGSWDLFHQLARERQRFARRPKGPLPSLIPDLNHADMLGRNVIVNSPLRAAT